MITVLTASLERQMQSHGFPEKNMRHGCLSGVGIEDLHVDQVLLDFAAYGTGNHYARGGAGMRPPYDDQGRGFSV
jgi:hypothetical protein